MRKNSSTYCPLPFIHSHAGVNRKFRPCCNAYQISDKHDWTYSLDNQTHEEWFTDEMMVQLRKDLLTGKRNDLCKVCWEQEDVGAQSYRQQYIKKYENVDVETPSIQYLDLKLSNECNLACRMCDYGSSHQIYKDMIALEQKNLHIPAYWDRIPYFEKTADKNMIVAYPENVVDEIKSLIPQLKYLKVTGGEPTITKKFNEIVDTAIDMNCIQDIELNLTTNGTRLTPDYLEKLSKFKKVKIKVSIDGIGSTYDYIRHPFKWQNIQDRIKDIFHVVDGRKFYLDFNLCATVYNAENIPVFYNWIQDNTTADAPLYIQSNLGPDDHALDFKWLSADVLHKSIKDLPLTAETETYIKRAESYMNVDKPKEQLVEIKNITTSLDQVRGQNYKDYLEPLTVKWLDSIDA